MIRIFNTDYVLYEGSEVADAIITDPPYGLTRAGYDEEIDLDAFWAFVKGHLREGGHLVSMADMAFAARLIGSRPRGWSWYDLIWRKTTKTGFLNARRRPLRNHEIIMVFRRPGKGWTYNPQMTHGHERKVSSAASKAGCKETELYGRHEARGYDSTDRYPESVLTFKTDKQKSCLHPSQKPVDLMRWLVRTYTNPGELVMDPFAGSGTTGVAAEIEGRNSILIERDNNYFKILENRIYGREKDKSDLPLG